VDVDKLKCWKCDLGRKGCYWNGFDIKGVPKGAKKTRKAKIAKIAKSNALRSEFIVFPPFFSS